MAHSAAVNCLKIGRKSSRVLVTGGEDHKVNLWAIGKPNAILVSSPSTSILAFIMCLVLEEVFYRLAYNVVEWSVSRFECLSTALSILWSELVWALERN